MIINTTISFPCYQWSPRCPVEGGVTPVQPTLASSYYYGDTVSCGWADHAERALFPRKRVKWISARMHNSTIIWELKARAFVLSYFCTSSTHCCLKFIIQCMSCIYTPFQACVRHGTCIGAQDRAKTDSGHQPAPRLYINCSTVQILYNILIA